MQPINLGDTFARYLIERELGSGGMGKVFLAMDQVLKRKVALKVLLPERASTDGAARFLREARLAAQLSHPNTVGIYDFGHADGRAFIAMEFVEGRTLSWFIAQGATPLRKKLAWLGDVGRALSAAHAEGLVHRDVKPSNVMVSASGAVKVLDFGLAKRFVPDDPTSFRTLEGRVLGTPRYMAPEQLAGEAVDARSDQYSWGVVAYELLAGVSPRANDADPRAHTPRLLTELDPSLPFRLAVLISRTLAHRAGDRYPSMNEVVTELDRAVAELGPDDSLPTATPRREGPVRPVVDETLAGRLVRPAGPVSPLSPTLGPAPAPSGQGAPRPKLSTLDRDLLGRADTAHHIETPGRIPPQRTLPSAGNLEESGDKLKDLLAQPAANLQTLPSAQETSGGRLGDIVSQAVAEVSAPRSAPLRGGASVTVALIPPAPRSLSAPWPKSTWLAVLSVGIVGVVAGAVLAAWALNSSLPEPPPVPASSQPR